MKTYDPLGRLLATTTRNAQLSIIDSFAYTYDAAGQREIETTPETQRAFGYDEHGQLTSAVTGPTASPALSLTYAFDPIGNRETTGRSTLSTQLSTSYTTNAVNQYTALR